jgi:hypothetical protein
MLVYEQLLNSDFQLALKEGDMFFQGEGAVQKTLRKIAQRLTDIGVEYAIVGGMAMYAHGFRRYTEDVDILVTPEGLKKIHQELEGLGYIRPFANSKHLRDIDTGVRVEFLITGQYPGSGKPGPIAFPAPSAVAQTRNGLQVVSLEALVELKLASSRAPGRLKDAGDVQELIKVLKLPRDFGARIHESVRTLYEQRWDEVQAGTDEIQ